MLEDIMCRLAGVKTRQRDGESQCTRVEKEETGVMGKLRTEFCAEMQTNKQNKACGSRCYSSKLNSGHMAIVSSAQSSRLL